MPMNQFPVPHLWQIIKSKQGSNRCRAASRQGPIYSALALSMSTINLSTPPSWSTTCRLRPHRRRCLSRDRWRCWDSARRDWFGGDGGSTPGRLPRRRLTSTESLSGNPLTLPLSPAARGERERKEPLRGQLAGLQIGSEPERQRRHGRGGRRSRPASEGLQESVLLWGRSCTKLF